LFQGSLRFNLDPFDMRSNEELWAVLRRVGLDALVGDAGGLEFAVEDGGANLSAGERQVLCLARVMLSRSAVVVLDEATSNVDSAFDQMIQSVVREEFRSSTILCIAHRLHTIIDSDRVLLLDKGELMEYDAPSKLVQRPSMFRDLLLDTGIESSRSLIRAATLARGVGKAAAPDAERAQEEQKKEEEESPYWHAYAGDFDVTRVDI
jgi:ABC-type multidrug transport system fused ATPase/permease subunit